MPELSIIIPTFNAEQFIERSLLSVIHQQYKKYEIIIQDCCSSDNTLKKIQELKATYPHVPISDFSEKDQGVYDAMNKAIEKARGTWIYFLGSDDYLYENVLQRVTDTIESFTEDYDLIYGNVNAERLGDQYDGQFDQTKISKQNICHQAIFYNKKIFTTIGIYNLKYKQLADWDFNIRSFFNDKITTKYIDITIAFYSDDGLSYTVCDEVFHKDHYPIVKKLGYKSLPLKSLKFFCNSNSEFLKLMMQRMSDKYLRLPKKA